MKLSFKNANNETFIFQEYYHVFNLSGFGDIPVTHQLIKAPYQDGETYIDTLFDPRTVTVEFYILGADRQELFNRRRTVHQHFNPKYGLGTLVWEDDSGSAYCLDCIPLEIVFQDGKGLGPTYQQSIIQFLAPNPFWYESTQIEKILVGFSGGLSFPFSFPISFGTVTSLITITNEGNVNTPVTIMFHGEVNDPEIVNLTTNETISVTKDIADGEILIINTAFGNKSVQIYSGGNYSDAFEYVDPDSVFWQLIPGGNQVRYLASFEGDNSYCQILFYNRYSGV